MLVYPWVNYRTYLLLTLCFWVYCHVAITRYDTRCDICQCIIDEHTTCLETFTCHICYVPNKVLPRSQLSTYSYTKSLRFPRRQQPLSLTKLRCFTLVRRTTSFKNSSIFCCAVGRSCLMATTVRSAKVPCMHGQSLAILQNQSSSTCQQNLYHIKFWQHVLLRIFKGRWIRAKARDPTPPGNLQKKIRKSQNSTKNCCSLRLTSKDKIGLAFLKATCPHNPY